MHRRIVTTHRTSEHNNKRRDNPGKDHEAGVVDNGRFDCR